MTKVEAMRRRLIRCCYQYYVCNAPMVSDQQYDLWFEKLQKLEVVPHPMSPTQMIYGDRESQYMEVWMTERRSILEDYDAD